MRFIFKSLPFICFLILLNTAYAQKGRIYGEVETRRGEKITGWIKWGGKEVVWDDLFDGSREIRYFRTDRDDRRRTQKYEKVESRTKFGYIKEIEFVYSNVAILKMKNGRTIEMEGGGNTDDNIFIIDADFGETELKRRNLKKVIFMQEPADYERNVYPRALPLWGEVKTRFRETFTGYIKWDNDEGLATDILDGKDEENISRKIPMGRIRSIEPYWSNSKIILKNGREFELGGSNDVNRENRGILIRIPDKYQFIITWRDFEKVTFIDDFKGKNYNDYKPAKRLFRVLESYDGSKHEGYITWDFDEAYTHDILDGQYNKNYMRIEFNNIKMIEYNSGSSARVTLKSGEAYILRGVNDVNSANKGIVVARTESGEGERIFRWDEFDKVTFR